MYESSRAVAVLFASLLIVSLAAVPVTGGVEKHERDVSDAAADDAVAADGPVVEVTRVAERRGDPANEVYVTLQYDIPSTVSKLRVRGVPERQSDRIEVVETDGFERRDDTSWTWEGGTDRPSLTVRYDLPTDRLTEADRGTAGDDWAFVAVPRPGHRYWYTGSEPSFAFDTDVVGEGVATDSFAFLGAHDVHERAANGETFRLYVPAAAEPAESPETVLGYLVDASGRLDIGGRNDEVHAFAVPSEGRTIRPRGATRGGNSFYVDADAAADADEAWVHEYVHTRQQFGRDPSAVWLVEGSASYYGIALRAHGENWTERRLYGRMDGNRSGTLTEPDTWEELTPYVEGRQFLAHLNLRLQRATGGDVTLTDLLRDLNAAGQRVTHDLFVETVRAYDGDTAAWADETLRSGEPLSTPRDPAAYTFAGSEPDGDGLNLSRERELGSSPFSTDTDGDGLADDGEAELGTDPTRADTDDDGVRDGADECPLEAGDGPDGCPTTATPTDGEGNAVGTADGGANESTETAGADGPVGPAPVLAFLAVALLGRGLARVD